MMSYLFLLLQSKVSQKENVDFSIIVLMVHSTVPAIEAMKTQPGPILQQFLDEVIVSGSISPTFKENDTTSSSTSQEDFKRMTQVFMDNLI